MSKRKVGGLHSDSHFDFAKIRKRCRKVSKLCVNHFANASQALSNLKQIAHTGLSLLNVCALRGLHCAAMMIGSRPACR